MDSVVPYIFMKVFLMNNCTKNIFKSAISCVCIGFSAMANGFALFTILPISFLLLAFMFSQPLGIFEQAWNPGALEKYHWDELSVEYWVLGDMHSRKVIIKGDELFRVKKTFKTLRSEVVGSRTTTDQPFNLTLRLEDGEEWHMLFSSPFQLQMLKQGYFMSHRYSMGLASTSDPELSGAAFYKELMQICFLNEKNTNPNIQEDSIRFHPPYPLS